MGVRNARGSVLSRGLITIPIFHQLIHSLSHVPFSSYVSVLLSSIFSLTFYAFLHVGEFTLSPHTIQILNCSLSPGSSLMISFRSFKFSRGSCPHLIIPFTGHDLCPVHYLALYLAVRPSIPGPLFITASGKPLSACSFSQYL